MNLHIYQLRVLAQTILQNAECFPWTLQGFGMLRMHLSNNYRLHVWDRRFAVPGVSTIHDHLQWGLESTILNGRIINVRFEEIPTDSDEYTHLGATFQPGANAAMKNKATRYMLREREFNILTAGDSYKQDPHEVHESRPDNGTVTLMRKLPTEDDSARIFWPRDTPWVSAAPRAATNEETTEICSYALGKWRWEQ